MNKTACFAIIFILLSTIFVMPVAATAPPPDLEAEAAVLMDQKTGKIVYAKNMDKQMYPASTTKILTALIAVERGDLQDIVTVGNEVLWIPWDGSKAGLDIGDTISLEDLIYGLMLPSGNDAAYTIAMHIARLHTGNDQLEVAEGLEVFSNLMNERASELGATNTNFTVPDGYHDEDHYTTAQDLALISKAAMNYDFLRQVVSTSRYVPETWQGTHSRPWGNTNQMVRPNTEFYYPQATGLKTGYTGSAGFCMVGSATQGDMELVAVVLDTNLDGRWLETTRLLEYGFENFSWQQLLADGDIVQSVEISNADRNQPHELPISASRGFGSVFSQDEAHRIEKNVSINEDVLDSTSTFQSAGATSGSSYSLLAPLEQGQVVGEIIFTLDNQEVFRTDLVATQDIASKPWWRDFFFPALLLMAMLLLFLVFIGHIRRRRRRRSRKKRHYFPSYPYYGQ